MTFEIQPRFSKYRGGYNALEVRGLFIRVSPKVYEIQISIFHPHYSFAIPKKNSKKKWYPNLGEF